jgi:hypothetical protein
MILVQLNGISYITNAREFVVATQTAWKSVNKTVQFGMLEIIYAKLNANKTTKLNLDYLKNLKCVEKIVWEELKAYQQQIGISRIIDVIINVIVMMIVCKATKTTYLFGMQEIIIVNQFVNKKNFLQRFLPKHKSTGFALLVACMEQKVYQQLNGM